MLSAYGPARSVLGGTTVSVWLGRCQRGQQRGGGRRIRRPAVSGGVDLAPLAGLLHVRERFAGAQVGIVCTGGNASLAELRAVLAED
ncbi:hypothetical protein [Fodinicola feengrottensis]|uniref:hypothetical protein n=1 Tax=Fodinicola feengrottensis TaxID=435914 RepID=UPI0013D63E79|nr:hypothetical protein [Fodinicola feengrottensis]